MLFTTPSQFVVLALVLVVGWLFGLASHPGGKKWKRAYQEEKTLHARNRELAEAQRREDAKRIAELEKANAVVVRDRAVAAPVYPGVRTPVAVTTVPRRTATRWFDWGDRRA